MMVDRRSLLLGGAGLVLGGCLERAYYEKNPQQKAFLDQLQALAKPALASNNPLQIEEAAKQSVVLWNQIGSFTDWRGVLKVVNGNAKNAAITLEIGPQVSLYAFNDWALAAAANVVNSASGFFSTRSRDTPPPGLSSQAVTALKTFRLGQTVALSGKMGEIAGSGLFDLTRLLGKGDGDNRQFLLAPRFLGRIETLAASE